MSRANSPRPGIAPPKDSSIRRKSSESVLLPLPSSSEKYTSRASLPTSTPTNESGKSMRTTLTMTVSKAAVLGQPPSNVEILLYSPWSTTAKTAARANGFKKGEKIRAVRINAAASKIIKKYGLSLSLCIIGDFARSRVEKIPEEKREDAQPSEDHAAYHEKNAAQDTLGFSRFPEENVEDDESSHGDYALPYPVMTCELHQKRFECGRDFGDERHADNEPDDRSGCP